MWRDMKDNPILRLALHVLPFSGQGVEDRWHNRVLTAVTIATTSGMFALGVKRLLDNQDGLIAVPDICEIISNHYFYLSQLILYRAKLPQIRALVNTGGFWPKDAVGRSLELKQRAIYKLGEQCLKICYLSSLFIMLPIFLLPFISAARGLPLLCHEPLDISVPLNFALMYTWQLFDSIMIVLFLLSMFGLLIGMFATLYCQTLMLREAIDQLDLSKDEQLCLDKIKSCIQLHCKLNKYFKNINNTFSLLNLNEFLVIVLNFCTALAMIAMFGRSNILLTAKCLGILFAYGWRLLLICFISTSYHSLALSVGECLYGTNWYSGVSGRMKTSLVLMLQRAQASTELRAAGGMIRLNMEYFLLVVRLSFSIYTLIVSFA